MEERLFPQTQVQVGNDETAGAVTETNPTNQHANMPIINDVKEIVDDAVGKATGQIPTYTAGDGIKIRNNEISVKVGEGIFYDENDNICLNQGTRNTLAEVAGKENKGKITIGETEYTVALSTTDEGQAGYITFVIEQ